MAFQQQEIPKEIDEIVRLKERAREQYFDPKNMYLEMLGAPLGLASGMKFTNTPAMKNNINSAFAAATRRDIYKKLKEVVSPNKNDPWSVKKYANLIRETTALPDALLARVTKVEDAIGPQGLKAAGEWNEPAKKLGLGSGAFEGVIEHELGGHNVTGLSSELIDKFKKDPAVKKAVSKMNPEQKDAFIKTAALQYFDNEKYIGPQMAGNVDKSTKFYIENYGKWPSETFARGISGFETREAWKKSIPSVVDEARKLGHRLSYGEYLRFANPQANRAAEGLKQNWPHDYDRYMEIIQRKLTPTPYDATTKVAPQVNTYK